MIITLTTENLEEYVFKSVCFISRNDNSFLIKLDVNEKMFYSPETILRLCKTPDITSITVNGKPYEVPYMGDGDTDDINFYEGVYFQANYLFLAFGERKVLCRMLEEENLSRKDEEAFLYAIKAIRYSDENLKPKSEALPTDGLTLPSESDNTEDSASLNKTLKIIAKLLAENYTRMDKPARTGWADGNPYKELLKDL